MSSEQLQAAGARPTLSLNPLELELRDWFGREELLPMLEDLVEQVLGEKGDEQFIFMLLRDDTVIEKLRRHLEKLEMEERRLPSGESAISEEDTKELMSLVEQKRGTDMSENEKSVLTSFLKLAEALYNQLDEKAWKNKSDLAAQMAASSNLLKLDEKDRWDSTFIVSDVENHSSVYRLSNKLA